MGARMSSGFLHQSRDLRWIQKGQSCFRLSHCLSQDSPFSCGSPTSSTSSELPPGRLRGPAPPRLRAREGAGRRRADTWRPQAGRAEGKRRLGLAGAARGRREGEGGETVVGLVLVLELGRPEGRGSTGGGRRQQHGGRIRAAQPSSRL